MPAVPFHQFVDRSPAVRIHRNRTADLATLDNGFPIKQVSDRFLVLVDIANTEAEQFRDASASAYTEHEKPAVADLVCAGETCGDSADLVVVKGSCAFHGATSLRY